MQLYEMQVSKTAIYRTAPVRIPKGIVGVAVKLSFSPEWEGLTKTVIFRSGDVVKDVLDVKDVAVIPAECTQEVGTLLEIGVYGVDAENTIAIPTLWAAIGRVSEAADPSGDTTTDPQLPVWAQLQAQIDQLERQGITQNEIEQAIRDFFGGERPTGKTTPEGGEIFNDYEHNQALAPYAKADGVNNTASGKASHAQNGSNTASGVYSSAGGFKNTASGESSDAGGDNTVASGSRSFTRGSQTEASGTASAAVGRETKATGYGSFAEGRNTIAAGQYQHVQGKWNVEDTKKAHIVGGGTSDTDRKNIYTLDWDGNAEFAGKVYSGGVELAPGGFGLGTNEPTILSTLSKVDNFKQSGWAAVTLSNEDIGGSKYGTLIVDASQRYIKQTFFFHFAMYGGFCELVRVWYYGDAAWREWEWKNPPMRVGVEYRTAERYNGKPVYARLFQYPGTIASGYNEVEHGIPDIQYVVRAEGVKKVSGYGSIIPVFSNDGMTGVSHYYFTEVSRAYIAFHASSNFANGELYVAMHYTKTTD